MNVCLSVRDRSKIDELVTLARSSIDRDASLHALVPGSVSLEQLEQEAARVVALRSQGATAGLLLGVKDLIHVEGLPTRAGTTAPSEVFAGEEGPVVRRLRGEGGALFVLGKTALDQLAYDHPPATVHPLNPMRTPGGSSFGSAAAVLAGVCDIALGTQTTASLIAPAAMCGLLAFKPSHERVSPAGVVPIAPSLDVIGLLTRDVDRLTDVAPMLLEDWSTKARAQRVPRIGVPGEVFFEEVPDYGWRRSFKAQQRCLAEQGVSPHTLDFPFRSARYREIYQAALALVNGEFAQVHGKTVGENREHFGHFVLGAIERGAAVSEAAQREARALRLEVRRELQAWLDAHEVDCVVVPSQLGPAPLRSSGRTSWSQTALLWSFAGLPAVNLPAGRVNGLPIGLQLIARWGSDEDLLQCTAALAALDFSSIDLRQERYDELIPPVL